MECPCARPHRGFTLVELLVALTILSLIALLSWRGLDALVRADTQLRARTTDVQAAGSALAQWGTDLDALTEQPGIPSLDWDGRVFRILRAGPPPEGGVYVVAWTLRRLGNTGAWMRWQSPPLATRSDLALAWDKAQAWGIAAGEEDRQREVRTLALESWQIYFYRGNAWTNPLSSEGAQAPEAAASSPTTPHSATPEGVRLVLTLAEGEAFAGTLVRDWARMSAVGAQ
ncbi:prepilin-type N-terminal cleavage/methylation domain-containing protein [Candidatus Symbiobacter mobilis]|uniref:General secretion pathway protein J n=1 Tax=Candidatus Symbiobacter mobilis CR TaxID=946483 RepID=U5N9X9_9BURK|nr:prepilin-type N-terminal cleavage/methylation domain-containing protein [Candidatus Symbiobacter mobilis]AGX88336.1 general secretion pathway protein J [Candidatus Symbiobacter mobilis CR]